jgi:hypothetical protein
MYFVVKEKAAGPKINFWLKSQIPASRRVRDLYAAMG